MFKANNNNKNVLSHFYNNSGAATFKTSQRGKLQILKCHLGAMTVTEITSFKDVLLTVLIASENGSGTVLIQYTYSTRSFNSSLRNQFIKFFYYNSALLHHTEYSVT